MIYIIIVSVSVVVLSCLLAAWKMDVFSGWDKPCRGGGSACCTRPCNNPSKRRKV